jgi:colicin import membrane protein
MLSRIPPTEEELERAHRLALLENLSRREGIDAWRRAFGRRRSILEQIRSQVSQMSEADVRAALEKLKADRKADRERKRHAGVTSRRRHCIAEEEADAKERERVHAAVEALTPEQREAERERLRPLLEQYQAREARREASRRRAAEQARERRQRKRDELWAQQPPWRQELERELARKRGW